MKFSGFRQTAAQNYPPQLQFSLDFLNLNTIFIFFFPPADFPWKLVECWSFVLENTITFHVQPRSLCFWYSPNIRVQVLCSKVTDFHHIFLHKRSFKLFLPKVSLFRAILFQQSVTHGRYCNVWFVTGLKEYWPGLWRRECWFDGFGFPSCL